MNSSVYTIFVRHSVAALRKSGFVPFVDHVSTGGGASLELIENHRDEGRARWWRKNLHVDLPELLHATVAPNAPAEVLSTTEPRATLASLAVDEEGREVIVLDLEGSRDQVSAKQLIARLSDEFGLSLDIPWNFIPEQLVLYSKKK